MNRLRETCDQLMREFEFAASLSPSASMERFQELLKRVPFAPLRRSGLEGVDMVLEAFRTGDREEIRLAAQKAVELLGNRVKASALQPGK